MNEQEKIKAEIEKLQARLVELEKLPELIKEGDLYEVTTQDVFCDNPTIIRVLNRYSEDAIIDMDGALWNHYRKLKIAPEWEDVPDSQMIVPMFDDDEECVAWQNDGTKHIKKIENFTWNHHSGSELRIIKFLRLPRV